MKRVTLIISTALWAACGTDVSGPAPSLYSCVFLEPATLGVGEAIAFQGPGNRSVCLTAVDDDAGFVYVPFFGGSPAGASQSGLQVGVEVLGAGVTSPPAMAAPGWPLGGLALPASARDALPPRDVAAHRRLRERELAELGPKIRAGQPADPRDGVAAAVAEQQVGELVEFNVATSCTTQDIRTGQVRYVSDHAVVIADVQNPAGFGTQDYQHFAVSFDTLVHPVAARHFGEPSDIDGNGRTIIFFTRAVNERTPPGSSTFTAALFWAGDLFPATATPRLEACPAGNQAEMFYLAVPDPNGLIGPAVPVAGLRAQILPILGHEYQHLINAARRLYVNTALAFEATWLNEGLSHIAEELLFYEVSGLGPRANITTAMINGTPGADSAFHRYAAPNILNLARYLQRPDTASLMGPDNLVTRGAAWAFLRYAADRKGTGDEPFFFALVNSTTAGLDNLNTAMAVSATDWIQDWTVALVADDHVPGLEPRHTQPSWNFRDLYAQGYPLNPPALAAGVKQSVSLQAGGAAYLRFGVAAGERAALHVESGGASPPRSLRGTFLRVH